MTASWSYLLITLWTHRVWNHHIWPKKLSCTYILSDYPIKYFCLLKTGNDFPFSSQILLCLIGKEAHRNNRVQVNMFNRGTFRGGLSLGWFVCSMWSIFKTKRNGKRKKRLAQLFETTGPLNPWGVKKKSYCLIYWESLQIKMVFPQNCFSEEFKSLPLQLFWQLLSSIPSEFEFPFLSSSSTLACQISAPPESSPLLRLVWTT